MKIPRFIECGFEFTAAKKQNSEPKGNIDVRYDGETLEKKDSYPLSKHEWITQNFTPDDCGCEVATPILEKPTEVPMVFKQFKDFVDKSNITLDINEAVGGLGGCHIHLDVSFMTAKFRKLFLQNIGIFFANNPQLNWGFNDVNDDCNANSLMYNRVSSIFAYCVYLKDELKDTTENLIKNRFVNDMAALDAYLYNPLVVLLYKSYAIRYNPAYESIELRIFDMPTSLKQHLLHYEVAMGIYKYCLQATKRNYKLKLKFNKGTGYKMTETEAIDSFKKVMKLLKINPIRTRDMLFNIKTRYAWNKEINSERSAWSFIVTINDNEYLN